MVLGVLCHCLKKNDVPICHYNLMSFQSIQFSSYGKPEEVLNLVESSLTELESNLKEGEVILRNLASPIHPSILYLIGGMFDRMAV